MAEKKRILILTADAGFGHRSAANAIASALCATYSEQCNVEVINPLEDRRVPSFLRDSQTEYDKFVRNMPDLYKLEYQISDSPVPAAVIDSSLTVILFSVIRTLIKKYDPQVILTTHSPEFLDAFGDAPPTTTVVEWQDGQTRLRVLTGESLDYWLKKYTLGELYRSWQLEAMT